MEDNIDNKKKKITNIFCKNLTNNVRICYNYFKYMKEGFFMAICPNCRTNNVDGAVNCAACGAPLSAPVVGGYAPVPAKVPGKGLAIASMVCGIVSFFCFGIVLGLLAVIFGGVAKSKGYRGGMATAGIVLGVIGLACYVIVLVTCGSAIMAIPGLDSF